MKMQMFCAAIACLALLSCGGKKEVDKIGDAQLCLDKLTSGASKADVQACTDKVDGMSSAGAEGIRCSANFIREGFSSGSRIISAFSAISSGTSGANVQAMMGILTFTTEGGIAADFANSRDTFYSCLASGGKGSTLLSSFSYMTMALIQYFSGKAACATTPANSGQGYLFYSLEGCVAGAAGDVAGTLVPLVTAGTGDAAAAAAQSSVGAVLVATYQLSCPTGASANTELCTYIGDTITAAGGAANTRQIAVSFFTRLGVM